MITFCERYGHHMIVRGVCVSCGKPERSAAMGQFRKKPVVIDAIQFTGKNSVDVLTFAGRTEMSEAFDGSLLIPTLEGTMKAEPGDWVIRGVKGELYPCKPDIFEATYEPATRDAPNEAAIA